MCFDPTERYFPARSIHLDNFPSYFFYYVLCILVFCSLSSVILMSVNIVIFLSVLCVVSMYCSDANIANCSA